MSSAVAVGRAFEALVRQRLCDLGMVLTIVGSAGDRGVDLTGSWTLPGLQAPVPIVVQCKRLSKRLAPRDIRELIGVVSDDARKPVGIMATGTAVSVESARAIQRTASALMWIHMSDSGQLLAAGCSPAFRSRLPTVHIVQAMDGSAGVGLVAGGSLLG